MRICIVGSGSISQNPRVVKEADALAAAGYDVVVLFPQPTEWERALDRRIIEGAKWRTDIIKVYPPVNGRVRKWIAGLQIRLFRQICRWTVRSPVAELASSRYFPTLLWRALRHRADLYIGHYTAGLPVVAWAAACSTGARFGFDFEDFHRGEASVADKGGLSGRLIATLEDRYLPTASFVTAASWGIAEEVAKTTGLQLPKTILNVFPWSNRNRIGPQKPRSANALSLYWFSQIVSLDRGLQDVIGAMGLMREPVELHIRGVGLADAIERLQRLAKENGFSERVHFHPLVHPDDLLASATEHDIGLCLEVPAIRSRDLCITNKIFLYILAGLAIVASRTRGHSDILNAAPKIGSLYNSGDIRSLATILDRYAADPALLARSKAAALSVARDRWNWERESQILTSVVGAFD